MKYQTGSREQKRFLVRTGRPVAASQILSQALKKYGLEQKIGRYYFVSKWLEIVGADLAARTRPQYLRGQTLVIEVCNSVWAQELSFYKTKLLKRLQGFLEPGLTVKDLVFYVNGERDLGVRH